MVVLKKKKSFQDFGDFGTSWVVEGQVELGTCGR